MGKPYIYLYEDKGYSRKHRTYEMQDGGQITALVTRYTYQMFYKPAQGPRGGRAKKQCARSLYYSQGVFYRACNVQREDGTYYNSLKVFEGVMWDCHQRTSVRQGVPAVTIECVEGIPVSVKDEGGAEVWAWGDPITELEDMLQIPDQDRAATSDQHETIAEDATETATEATTAEEPDEQAAFESARADWIASTTTEGQQLDLISFFGYGDATWQDLAAPAA